MNYRDTMNINGKGILQIGGVETTELIKKYGSPLYVMDVEYIENVVNAYKNTIDMHYGYGNIAYASKAFSCMAIYQLMTKLDSAIDVVSGGEIYTAVKTGFDMSKVYFHGNNKLDNELDLALTNKVGTIVIDNIAEAERIDSLAKRKGFVQKVIIRINPGVEAHTHKFIQTATVDSKFGFSIKNEEAIDVIKKIKTCKNLYFAGLHCHIGSQIFDKAAFALAVNVVTDFCVKVKNELSIEIDELNLGGGFGIYYSKGDPEFNIEEYCDYVKTITDTLSDCVAKKGIKKPYLILEPGRSIVGEAGITLYTVGNIKDIKGIRKYIAIDGGMFDNIRPALYDAQYEAILANRGNEEATDKVTIAGKCCESGDIIIKDVLLPVANRGDIVAVFSTGAYNYSMASNYNRNFIPPVIFVKNGKSNYAIRPQTNEDLVRNDLLIDLD